MIDRLIVAWDPYKSLEIFMEYDYIVIGAGIIGSATAYHLKRVSPASRVLLVDGNRRVGAGNTARSAALYRNIFSSLTSRMLAGSSIKYYRELGDKIALNPLGYLWLFSKSQWARGAEALRDLDPQRENFEVLDQGAVTEILRVNTQGKGAFQDVAAGIYARSCGSLSAMALTQHYASEFVKMGGVLQLGRHITTLLLSGEEYGYAPWCDVSFTGIADREGTADGAAHLIVAAGAWTPELLLPVGIAPGVLPKKRQLFGVTIKDWQQIMQKPGGSILPIVVLPTGKIYFKPILDKNLIVLGCADGLGQPFERHDPEPDVRYFQRALEPVLRHYFPALADYALTLRWAGFYAYYWPDNNPVVERVANLTWVSGTSGSGIMKGDALGRIAAAKAQGLERARLFDGNSFQVSKLSLRSREVEKEGLVI